MAEKTAFRKTSNTGALYCPVDKTAANVGRQQLMRSKARYVGGEFEIDFGMNEIHSFALHFI